jgi:nucleoid-associated protein YgaU
MSYKVKYQSVLELGEALKVQNGLVEETSDTLKIAGTTQTQWEKDQIWDKIKEVGGENPKDIEADIKVENTDWYHRHTVESGDTLGKIAAKYYGAAGKYMEIFNANNTLLKDPNVIHPGQELVIPNLN